MASVLLIYFSMKTHTQFKRPGLCSIALYAMTMAFVVTSASANPKEPLGHPIRIWTRSDGDHSGGKPLLRKNIVDLDLETRELQTAELNDHQYQQKSKYRGVYLDTIFAGYVAPKSADLALLHFDNGVVIPYPLAATKTQPNGVPALPKAFVAMRIWDTKTNFWTTRFPKAARHVPGFRDARPIRFAYNKIVVETPTHPMVPDPFSASVDLWRVAGTLVGIEFVNEKAYYQQFSVSTEPNVQLGLNVFKQTCQFCHGVRKVGASLGWDFVHPFPVYRYRNTKKNLYYHVKYQILDAPEKGLLMPALKNLSAAEASAVWEWLRAVGTQPLKPYQSPQ